MFEDGISDEERAIYVATYPNVDDIVREHLHCTACNRHIGAMADGESSVRMHPVLRVTLCRRCMSFYNSGEFIRDDDGSEVYCRWCGQGGEVYCCSNCPYVFCRKCIVRNLSESVINDIEATDTWKCFSCEPQIILPLRAQHWAWLNYIRQLKM